MKPFDTRLLTAVPAARRPVTALAVVAAAQGAAAIAVAVSLALFVAAVATQGDWRTRGVWLLAAFLVRALLAVAAERVAVSAGATVSSALRRGLLARWLSVPVDERPDPARASVLATEGASAVEPYAARYLPALVAAVVVPVLAVVALLFVDPWSALIVVLTLPLLPLFAALIGASTRDDTTRRWQALEQLAGHFGDVMRGLPTLVAYGRARRQVDVVRTVSERHRGATMRTLRLAFMSSAALELLATISVAIVAVVVGLRLSHGSMSLEAGLLAILLAPEAYWPIRRVGQEFHAAADGAQALDDFVRAGDGLGSVTAPEPSPTHRTSGWGVGLTAVTGPSGVGKTTLLDRLAGVRRTDRLPEVTAAADRLGIGADLGSGAVHYVTQQPFLPDGSVTEVLTLGAGDVGPERQWEALRRVGLDGVVMALPDGFESRLGDDGFGLSAGQRTRLGLARALLSDAPVLLLDEPTAHLDGDAAALVHDLVVDLARTRRVIAATHSPQLAALADDHVRLGARVEVPA